MQVQPISTVLAHTAYQRKPQRFLRPQGMRDSTSTPRPAMRRYTDVDIVA